MSLSICHYLDFNNVGKTYWLYDTWNGVPITGQETQAERSLLEKHNKDMYHVYDVYDATCHAFSVFPNVKMIRGILPGTLNNAPEKIAYLSMDLNHAGAEMACINKLWDRISDGAFIVLDDYAFAGHRAQKDAWDAFAKAKNHHIATLPTGQGLLLKMT